jgi:hypothetical protein
MRKMSERAKGALLAAVAIGMYLLVIYMHLMELSK